MAGQSVFMIDVKQNWWNIQGNFENIRLYHNKGNVLIVRNYI